MEDLRKVISRTATGSNAEKPLTEATVKIRKVRIACEAEFSFPASTKFNEHKAKLAVAEFLDDAHETGDMPNYLMKALEIKGDIEDDPDIEAALNDGELYFTVFVK